MTDGLERVRELLAAKLQVEQEAERKVKALELLAKKHWEDIHGSLDGYHEMDERLYWELTQEQAFGKRSFTDSSADKADKVPPGSTVDGPCLRKQKLIGADVKTKDELESDEVEGEEPTYGVGQCYQDEEQDEFEHEVPEKAEDEPIPKPFKGGPLLTNSKEQLKPVAKAKPMIAPKIDLQDSDGKDNDLDDEKPKEPPLKRLAFRMGRGKGQGKGQGTGQGKGRKATVRLKEGWTIHGQKCKNPHCAMLMHSSGVYGEMGPYCCKKCASWHQTCIIVMEDAQVPHGKKCERIDAESGECIPKRKR